MSVADDSMRRSAALTDLLDDIERSALFYHGAELGTAVGVDFRLAALDAYLALYRESDGKVAFLFGVTPETVVTRVELVLAVQAIELGARSQEQYRQTKVLRGVDFDELLALNDGGVVAENEAIRLAAESIANPDLPVCLVTLVTLLGGERHLNFSYAKTVPACLLYQAFRKRAPLGILGIPQ